MKYIRKHINEAVRLPSRTQQSTISLTDIANANANYIKNVLIPRIFNDAFNKNKILKLSGSPETTTVSYAYNLLAIPQKDGQNDFSPSIVNVTPLQGKYIVTIAIALNSSECNVRDDDGSYGACIALYCNKFIKSLIRVCNTISKHNDIISDINFVCLPMSFVPTSTSHYEMDANKLYDARRNSDKYALIKCINAGITNIAPVREITINDTSIDFIKNAKYYEQFIHHCVNKFTNVVRFCMYFTDWLGWINSSIFNNNIGYKVEKIRMSREKFNDQHLQALLNIASKEHIKIDRISTTANIDTSLLLPGARSSISNITIDNDMF